MVEGEGAIAAIGLRRKVKITEKGDIVVCLSCYHVLFEVVECLVCVEGGEGGFVSFLGGSLELGGRAF